MWLAHASPAALHPTAPTFASTAVWTANVRAFALANTQKPVVTHPPAPTFTSTEVWTTSSARRPKSSRLCIKKVRAPSPSRTPWHPATPKGTATPRSLKSCYAMNPNMHMQASAPNAMHAWHRLRHHKTTGQAAAHTANSNAAAPPMPNRHPRTDARLEWQFGEGDTAISPTGPPTGFRTALAVLHQRSKHPPNNAQRTDVALRLRGCSPPSACSS